MSEKRRDVLDNYVQDLITLLKDKAREAKAEHDAALGSDRLYASGRLMAFHEVISLMQQQGVAFGIPLSELWLEDIVPERDLV